MPKPGDRVQIITADETITGTFMPDPAKDFVVVKLSTGYNLGVHTSRVKEVKVLQQYVPVEQKPLREQQTVGLHKISILHTGGTIASKVDYETGGAFAHFNPEDLLNMFPELKTMAVITSRLVRRMWSEDIRFAHYNILAREIATEVKNGAHAIIIAHGTDTLHYTAAALAFMIQHPPVPIILVGAQRSSDRGGSDAAWNLLSAVTFVTNTNFSEVGICMHENMSDECCVILPGTKTRKMHSSRRDAFKAINTTAWARVHPKTRKIEFLRTDYHCRHERKDIAPKFMKENIKVGILKTHTNMWKEQFLLYKGWDGLVLEGGGIAGNPPINEIDEFTKEHTAIYDAIKELVKTGTVVVAATQTIYGGLNMNVYTTGKRMQEAGILGNYTDMTAETAFLKLAWLLSNYPKDEVPELFCMNLVGEISPRLEKTE